MPDPALLDPNNRLLGWSTSDFSLYGGQPTVTLGTPRTGDAGGAYVSVPSALAPAAAPGSPAPVVADAIAAIPVAGVSGEAAPTGFLDAPAVAPAAPLPATPAMPGVPDPLGSGSLAPAGVALPSGTARAAEGSDAAAAAPAANAFAAPVLDLAPVAAPLGGLAGAVANPAIVAPVLALVDAAGTAAADLAGATVTTLATALDDTADATAALLDGLVTALPVDTVAATAGLASDTVTAATDAAADTLAGTTDTLTDGTEAVTQALGDTTDIVAETVGAALSGVGATAGAITAPLAEEALGGSDPAGGVSTLVGMVESADLFDLAATGSEPAAITEGGSILDALAADEAPSALLGVDDNDGGLLGGTDPHDHDGGLLGGL